MDRLQGKVAVVTAGASGMGLAMARRFAAEGMKVVIADIDDEAIDASVADLHGAGADAVGLHTDVSDAAAVGALKDLTYERYGAAHVVCSHAGAGGGGRISAPPVDLAGWHRAFDVCVFGMLNLLNEFLPGLLAQDDGHVVTTSSRQGLIADAGLGAYSPAKAAVVTATEMLSAELRAAGSKVGVSVLCPGGVRTKTLPSPDQLAVSVDDRRRQIMAQRYAEAAEPDEVAELVLSAIREKRLYVLTHAETIPWMQARFDAIKSDLSALGAIR
ncbi:MAG: SDR family NAD(P)-dependent oxidoreductase [Acidimicrobiales bacterium]|nr:SDR family NAD(P)-dependent oxidoreductase [Acidimicrobiales bacterium]